MNIFPITFPWVPIHLTDWNFRRCCNLSVGRQRENNSWETYPITTMQERDYRAYVIGKLMANTANTDGLILIIHREMNHRLDFHLCPIKQALPSVVEVMWLRKEGERIGRERKKQGETTSTSSTTQVLPLLCRQHLIPALSPSTTNWTITSNGQLIYFLFFFHFYTLGCISPFHQHPCRNQRGPFHWTYASNWTLNSLDMFCPGQLVSTLLPAVFNSPAAHFFPAFPTRLGSQPQILIPGPFISYESLRNYLQPEPCKEALLLATQAVRMGQLTEGIGEFKLQP